MERRAVVEHDGAAARQPADQPVPHHPAAGGEVEQPIIPAEIRVELVLLEMLDEGAADPVDDALGLSGGSGRVHDVQRIVKSALGESEIVVAFEERGVGYAVAFHQIFPGQGDPDDGAYGGDALGNLARLVHGGDRLAVVVVTVAGEQHLRLDLPEPIQRALGAEVGRARRPDAAQGGGGQHGGHRLRHVWQPPGNPVSRVDVIFEPRGDLCRLAAQLGVGNLTPLAGLQKRYQGRAIIVEAQEIFGEVQPRALEPSGSRQLIRIGQDRGWRLGSSHVREMPDQIPEGGGLFDRPGVQVRIARHGAAGYPGGFLGEAGHVRFQRPDRIRAPDGPLGHPRTWRKQFLSSPTNSSGCSKAAKCPPRSSSFQ